jgi:DNA-binding LacI/PurR family transcriptional regulator
MHNQNDNPKVRTSVNPAIGAMLEDQAQDIRAPDGMSIFRDDVDLMGELRSSITAVRVAGDEVGCRAGDVLVSPLEADDTETGFECETQIIVRASSRPPRDRHKMR